MCDGTGRAPENSCCTPWGGSHRGKDRRCARGPNLKLSKKITSITASPVDLLFPHDCQRHIQPSLPSTQKHRLLLQTRDPKEFANGWESWTRWLSWGEFQQALDPQKWIPRTPKKTGLDSTGLVFAGMEFPHGSSLPGWELQSCRSCKLDWELHLRNMRQTYSRYKQAVTSLSSVETVHSELL